MQKNYADMAMNLKVSGLSFLNATGRQKANIGGTGEGNQRHY